jgi:type IV pilus assembly protein PilW
MIAIVRKNSFVRQFGFGLVEIMVALAIGLITALIVMQVVTTFEGQKRTTTGNADAQTSGSTALYLVKRDAEMAGYGMPLFSEQHPAFDCNPLPTLDHDANPATPEMGVAPVTITRDGVNDTVVLRSGPALMGGSPLQIIAVSGSAIDVTNNLGCSVGDVAFLSSGAACSLAIVTAIPDPNINTNQITLSSTAGVSPGDSVACMGGWAENTYNVDTVNKALRRNGAPIAAGIVAMRAQYGVSATPATTQIVNWVDADAMPNPNIVRAIRVAVVAQNGMLEKEIVSDPCNGALNEKEVCSWPGGPALDLSADPTWRQYRYRVFETIIPLRNVLWN